MSIVEWLAAWLATLYSHILVHCLFVRIRRGGLPYSKNSYALPC